MGTQEVETPPHPAKRVAFNMAKAIAVIIPAVASSYFGYRQAIFESAHGTTATKATAEAGYQTLVSATEKFAKVISDLEKDQARLEGRLLALEARLNIPPIRTYTRFTPLGLGGVGGGSITLGGGSLGAGASDSPSEPSHTPSQPSHPHSPPPRHPFLRPGVIRLGAIPPVPSPSLPDVAIKPPTVFKPLPRTLDQAQQQLPNLPMTAK